jgi:hypothetical protein
MDSFRKQQTAKFNVVAPNQIPSNYVTAGGKVPTDIRNIGTTVNPLTNSIENPAANLDKIFTSKGIPPELQEKLNFCQTASLDELRANQDPNAPFRCGWLYKAPATASSPYAQRNEGAYGNKKGAMYPPADGGRWFWDLEAAKKQIMIDKCRAMTSCSMVEDSTFIGCGFSTTKQRGIPVNEQGGSLYNDQSVFTPASRIITKAGKCPPPPATTVAGAAAGPVDICKQLPNNKLSRDCIMRKVLDVGCKPSGTIHRALQHGNALNYTRGIDSNKAYKVYQQRANTKLNVNMMRDGNLSVGDVLKNINAMHDVAISNANTGFAFAARDLCLNAGEIDKFDFCSELSASTPGPYSLECLQKLFRERGGTPGGAWWPSSTTITWYNRTFNRWGDVIKAIEQERQKMEAGQGNSRVDAYRNIMGIELEKIPQVREGGVNCKISTENSRFNTGRFLRGQMVDRLAQCQQICCGNADCQAYNYIDGGGQQRECQILGASGSKRSQGNVVSGEKQ